MQELNRKLQTMFGLEPDSVEGIEINGQGGEEFPYESSAAGEPGQSPYASKMKNQANSILDSSQASMVVSIERGLVWLDRQALKEQAILDDLAATAGERADRWLLLHRFGRLRAISLLSLVQEFHRLLGKRLYIQVWILDLRGAEKLKLQLQEKWLRQPTILGWEISFGLIMDMELKRPTDTCRKCL